MTRRHWVLVFGWVSVGAMSCSGTSADKSSTNHNLPPAPVLSSSYLPGAPSGTYARCKSGALILVLSRQGTQGSVVLTATAERISGPACRFDIPLRLVLDNGAGVPLPVEGNPVELTLRGYVGPGQSTDETDRSAVAIYSWNNWCYTSGRFRLSARSTAAPNAQLSLNGVVPRCTDRAAPSLLRPFSETGH